MATIKNSIILVFLLIATSSFVFAQEKVKTKTSFGLQFSPIFNNSINNKNNGSFINKEKHYNIKQETSYLFGMELRHDLSAHFIFQTGINFIQRKYAVTLTENSDISNSEFKMLSSQVPVYGFGYIRIAPNIYMEVGVGLSLEFLPTNINSYNLHVERRKAIQPTALTSVGLELRTQKKGCYYLGFSYNYLFNDMIDCYAYNNSYLGYDENHKDYSISGDYISVIIKYFFPVREMNYEQ